MKDFQMCSKWLPAWWIQIHILNRCSCRSHSIPY